jgi:hypothetical protein
MICPTRNRPDRVKDMLKSFYDTKRNADTHICLAVSKDDEKYDQYFSELPNENIITCPSRYLINKTNYICCELFPDIPYYGGIDDDHIFRTKNWDKILLQKLKDNNDWGLACGNDKFNEDWKQWSHPSGWIMSNKTIKFLGYAMYPKFIHSGIDHWQADLFGNAECLYYVPEVIIEHCHYLVKKAKDDKGYAWVYDGANFNEAMKIYHLWKYEFMEIDVERLKRAIRKDKDNNG